jgi:hypothetical protein
MPEAQKQINQILRKLQSPDHGCTVTSPGKGGHWKVTKPGCRPVFISQSPSDFRAMRNILRDIRYHLGISL